MGLYFGKYWNIHQCRVGEIIWKKRKRKNGEHGDRKIHNRTNKGKVESKNVF
jgi:hypothetical protein